MQEIRSYKDLIVWQKAIKLCVTVYRVTEKFPAEEIYGLTSQMRRAAVSIPSNIAEGSGRSTRKDFAQFLRVALGSSAELQTQLEIAKNLKKTAALDYMDIGNILVEIIKMLHSLIRKLTTKN